MREETYGWNLEMQMRAAQCGLRIREVPVSCRKRAGGVSKVAGSLSGSLRAAIRITQTLLRVASTPLNHVRLAGGIVGAPYLALFARCGIRNSTYEQNPSVTSRFAHISRQARR